VTVGIILDPADHKAVFLIVDSVVVVAAAVKASQGTPGTPDPFVVPSADGATQDETAFQAPSMKWQAMGA